MTDAPSTRSAVIVGSSGGLGAAFARALAADGSFAPVHAWSRGGAAPCPGTRPGRIDLGDEASIVAAAASLVDEAPPGLVIVATGALHGPGLAPEKSWRALEPAALAASFAVNAIGPALVAKHLLPLFPRHGRSVFAALSARVGSIGDNRLGGWYAYRASKAALNQILRTLAIELARSRPEAICLGLHPGTVATGLSAPFRGGVAPERLFAPDDAARRLLAVTAAATPADSGSVLDWAGTIVLP